MKNKNKISVLFNITICEIPSKLETFKFSILNRHLYRNNQQTKVQRQNSCCMCNDKIAAVCVFI